VSSAPHAAAHRAPGDDPQTERSPRRRALRLRTRLAVVTAATLAIAAGGTYFAFADTTTGDGAITGTSNGSDPELIQCPNSTNTGMTLCLFTSYDMGSAWGGPVPYTGPTGSNWNSNYYPMNGMYLWRLQDGKDASKAANWNAYGAQLNENDLVAQGIVPETFHMWAPGVRWWNNKFYFYVPDVWDPTDESHSSRVALWTSTDPGGTNCTRFSCSYVAQGWVSNSSSQINKGYQSDPNLFIDPSSGAPYYLYANGDYSNCGGISMAPLNSTTMTTFTAQPHQIAIDSWGTDIIPNSTCTTLNTGHPYLEGPAMYLSKNIGAPTSTRKYTLIFAAKPQDGKVPTSCKNAGSTSDKEVIAYATGDTPTGLFHYQGIMMCGSTAEWTNQASIVQSTNISTKYLFAWHDGKTGTPNYHERKTHLMCVRWNSNGTAAQIPRSVNNLSNCP
jgi:hypothetical protein